MSDFKKHNWFAVGASALVLIATLAAGSKFEVSLILSVAVYLGANFPDLDTASTPSKWAARFALVSSAYFIYVEEPIYGLIVCMIYISPKVSKHRGWTHKFSTPVLITATVLIIFREYTLIAVAFSVGLLAHYALDRLNPFEFKNWI